MAICPEDGKGCCDDLCYGSGCMKGGGPMLERCDFCGQVIYDWGCECEEEGDCGYYGEDNP